MTALFCLFLTFAQAGYLRIVGEPHLQIQVKEQKVFLKGSYQLANQGDEEALQVFPELQIDHYTWQGKPENLKPGKESTWQIDEEVGSLCTTVSDVCPVALPLKGTYLVRVRKHYQDLNGYPFSVADMFTLSDGDIPSPMTLEIDLSVRPPAAGDPEYEAHYTIRNPTKQPLRAQLHPWLPQEVVLTDSLSPVNVPADGQVQGDFHFRNEKGLPGSEYAGFLSAEWEANQAREGQFVATSFKVEAPKVLRNWTKEQVFAIWWSCFAIAGLVLIWFFWVRPLQQFRKTKRRR